MLCATVGLAKVHFVGGLEIIVLKERRLNMMVDSKICLDNDKHVAYFDSFACVTVCHM